VLKEPALYPALFSSPKVVLNLLRLTAHSFMKAFWGNMLVRFKSQGEHFDIRVKSSCVSTGTVAQQLRTVLKN
jgi:hypothetical protein